MEWWPPLPGLEEWQAWRATLPPLPPPEPGYEANKWAVRPLLHKVQGSCCGVCLLYLPPAPPPTPHPGNWYPRFGPSAGLILEIDHDHWTDLVRGLLCRRCNCMDNRCEPPPVWAAYQANPPAFGSGWRYRGDPPTPEQAALNAEHYRELLEHHRTERKRCVECGGLCEPGHSGLHALCACDREVRRFLRRTLVAAGRDPDTLMTSGATLLDALMAEVRAKYHPDEKWRLAGGFARMLEAQRA